MDNSARSGQALARKPRRTGRALALFVALLMAAAAFSGCGKGKSDQAVIATYQGGQVTQGEFDTYIRVNSLFDQQVALYASDPEFQNELLKQLIAFKILADRADDNVKKEADKKVKEQLDQITLLVDSQGGRGAFDRELRNAKVSKNDLKWVMQQNFYAIDAMESQVDDSRVKQDYDEMLKADPNAFVYATVSHILIALKDAAGNDLRTKEQALERAKEVRDKLKNGGDFAALAKEYSDDGSKDDGGKLGDLYPVSAWVPEFKKAAVELALNQISDPVETQFGYHIIKVEERTTKTFEEVKESLRSQIASDAIYEFMDKELPGLIESTNLPQPNNEAPQSSDQTNATR